TGATRSMAMRANTTPQRGMLGGRSAARLAPVSRSGDWLAIYVSSSASASPPPQPDAHRLSGKDRDDAEGEQKRERRRYPQQCAVKDRVRDDQRKQGVVQALEPLPGRGFERA